MIIDDDVSGDLCVNSAHTDHPAAVIIFNGAVDNFCVVGRFPDADADRSGGRRHLVIVLGKRRAAILYALSLMVMYLILIAGILAGKTPTGTLLGYPQLILALGFSLFALQLIIEISRKTKLLLRH